MQTKFTAVLLGNAYGVGDELKQRFTEEGISFMWLEEEQYAEVTTIHERIDYAVLLTDEYHCSPFLETDETDWDEGFHKSLLSAFRFSRTVLPAMMRQRFGSIVFLSSSASRTGDADAAIYAAAKGGLLGFVRSLALEAAQAKVRVNLVSAVVKGDVTDTRSVADTVLFLLQQESSFITGQDIEAGGVRT